MRKQHRGLKQIKEHYEAERKLARILRHSSRKERRILYAWAYTELYRRVPHHPLLTQSSVPERIFRLVQHQFQLIKRFIDRKTTFLEIGPGDCSLSFKVSKFVKRVYAMEVSTETVKCLTHPNNFQLILSDGISIPLQANSVNVAYSNQVVEHLHPDDLIEQIQETYDVLTAGGVYICVTPNRLIGPSDISAYFDTEASGLHLREYTTYELSILFRRVGFSKVRTYVGARGRCLSLPVFPVELLERLLCRMPHSARRKMTYMLPFRVWLGIRLVGIK